MAGGLFSVLFYKLQSGNAVLVRGIFDQLLNVLIVPDMSVFLTC